MTVPWNPRYNAIAYVLAGAGTVGEERRPVRMGQTTVFGSGDTLTVAASDGPEPLEVFLLGGEPIRQPIAMAGPFVMNTKAEVLQAFEDFQAGRFGQP